MCSARYIWDCCLSFVLPCSLSFIAFPLDGTIEVSESRRCRNMRILFSGFISNIGDSGSVCARKSLPIDRRLCFCLNLSRSSIARNVLPVSQGLQWIYYSALSHQRNAFRDEISNNQYMNASKFASLLQLFPFPS